jgi:YD repeat-containing protein
MNQTTTFEYDKLDRMLSRSDSAGTSTWYYDTAPNGVGKVSKIDSLLNKNNPIIANKAIHDGLESYTRFYNYDSFSRTSQINTTIKDKTYATSYTYDQNGQIATETYPNGLQTKNTYEAGRLVAITDAQTGKIYWRLNKTDAAEHILCKRPTNHI